MISTEIDPDSGIPESIHCAPESLEKTSPEKNPSGSHPLDRRSAFWSIQNSTKCPIIFAAP